MKFAAVILQQWPLFSHSFLVIFCLRLSLDIGCIFSSISVCLVRQSSCLRSYIVKEGTVLTVVVLELNLRKAYTYQNGNQKPLIEQQAMKWPKQNGQTLYWATRTPQKSKNEWILLMHFIPILSYDFGSYCWLDVPSASVCDIFKCIFPSNLW